MNMDSVNDTLDIVKGWAIPLSAFLFISFPWVLVWPILTGPRDEHSEAADGKDGINKMSKKKAHRRTFGLLMTVGIAIAAALAISPGMRDALDGLTRLVKMVSKVAISVDLDKFEEEHRELYAQAVNDGNYSPVTIHYYSVQASILQIGVGHYWHFMPENPSLSLDANFGDLNQHFADRLSLKPNETLCELGCGLCRTGRDVADRLGAKFIGVTMSPEEVELGTAELNELGLSDRATIIQGDYTQTPLAEGKCDAVLAVFTLKYSQAGAGGKLNSAFSEIRRILRPSGRFVSYEILTADAYDETNATHAGWSYNISYHTGMPPLNSVRHFREDAVQQGLSLVEEFDMESRENTISTGHSFPFRLYSDLMVKFLYVVDALGLKQGLAKYSENFVIHPTLDLRDSMLAGAVTSSTIFTYERPVTRAQGA